MMQPHRIGCRYLGRFLWIIPLTFMMVVVVGILVGLDVVSAGDEGGTDEEITIYLEHGEDKDWNWNDLREFLILENGTKVDEYMNISLSTEGVEWSDRSSYYSPDGRYGPTGHHLGSLEYVYWDDNPILNITIDENDFEEYTENGHDLEVLVFGEYTRSKDNETLLRQVFTTVVIERPNQPVADGGTDEQITIKVEYGSDGEYDWNSLRGFQLFENGTIVDEEMNITVCEDVKFNVVDMEYRSSGHVFGEVSKVHWDNDPPVNLSIDVEDFNDYSEDMYTLEVYVLGEYSRTIGNETELRQVYAEFTIYGPYSPPVPVIMLSVGENQTWFEVGNENNFYIKIDSLDPEYLHFNLSGTFDPDGDAITSWSVDGSKGIQFGATGSHPGSHSELLEPDDSYRFYFLLFDSRGMSTMESFNFEFTTHHLQPNITIESVEVSNLFPDVNEGIDITITINNSGKRQANYVDINFIIDGEYQYFRTIDRIGGEITESIIIPFKADSKGSYNLSFKARDDDIIRDSIEGIFIHAGYDLPQITIDTPKNNSRISITQKIVCTLTSDEPLFTMLPIEVSVNGGPWEIASYSTVGTSLRFDLNASDHLNETIIIRVRTFDGRQYSENESIVVKVRSDVGSESSSDSSTPSPSLIAGGVVLFGTVGLGGLAFFREDLRYSLFSILMLPFYSKLRRDDILNEGNRQDIYQIVISRPGVNLTTIKQDLGIGHGTVIHHLTVLEDRHMIRSKKEFGRRLFFPNGSISANTAPPQLSLIQKQILNHLRTSGPKVQQEIASELGMKQQTVSYSIDRLQKYGLIQIEGTGKGALFHAIEDQPLDAAS